METITQEKINELRNEANFFKPILKILQENGGEVSGYSQFDKLIPSYTDFTEDEVNFFKITDKGNKYTPYHFGRNFAVKNLELAGYLTYSRNEPIKLTQKGLDANIDEIDIDKDIYEPAKPYWDKKNKESKLRRQHSALSNAEGSEEKESAEPVYQNEQEWRENILSKVKSLDPFRFETFCRGLLNKMGFEIDSIKGIVKSGDGGIDGFGYCLDSQSLKTTRVAVQCKKYTDNPVGSPEINNLRGAIDTHRAEYGIFITTSYFSSEAIKSSREGGTPITLINGEELVDLMVKYKYKVHEVPTYIPDEDYFDA